MKRPLHRRGVAILAALWASHPLRVSSSTSSTIAAKARSAASSPVANWGASWTASAAQGTTVAVACAVHLSVTSGGDGTTGDDDATTDEARRRQPEPLPAVVILFRSSSTSSSSLPPPANGGGGGPSGPADTCLRLDGVRVRRVDPHTTTLAGASRRWTRLGASGTVCCMTGFAVDVDALTRRLQRAVEDEDLVYDAHRRPPALQTVRALAETLRTPTQWDGTRPFGVQALVVGPAAHAPPEAGAGAAQAPRRLSLFTLDPGGGHRHWGAATAIGRAAARVRRRLHAHLVTAPAPPLAAGPALAVALAAAAAADDADAAADRCEALIVWSDREGIQVAAVDPAELQRIRASLPDTLGSASTKGTVVE